MSQGQNLKNWLLMGSLSLLFGITKGNYVHFNDRRLSIYLTYKMICPLTISLICVNISEIGFTSASHEAGKLSK